MSPLRPLLLSALLALLAPPAWAQKGAAAPAAGKAPAAGTKGERRKRAIRLDAVTVEGRVQKPQAFYILQRSSLDFEELSRAETFLPKVLQSVDKEAL